MNKGWITAYLGIALLSTGASISGGIELGLAVSGVCLIVAGMVQIAKYWD
jgi:hypothetical protein